MIIDKQILSFLAMFLLGIVIFTGCSAARHNAGTGVVTVALNGWGDQVERQLMQEVIKNFEAKHPQIKVKYEVIADQYTDVLKTRLIGETAADVFYLDALDAPTLMIPGVLEPLDNYIASGVTDFEPTLLNAFKQDGKTYGLPKDFSTLALFYNTAAFQAAGLSQPPKTWEELREYSQRLTIDKNGDGKIEQYGFGVIPELARQAFMVKAFGGQLVNPAGQAIFASPAGLRGLQLIIDQYRQDKSSAQPSDIGATTGIEMFGQGKVAMVIEGAWAIPYMKQTFPNVKYKIVVVPKVGVNEGTMAYTVAYVMNSRSKHKPEAWQLISYLTGKEGMKVWTEGGFALPTRKSVAAVLGYDRNPLYAPFIGGASYATIWQAGKNLPIILNNFNNQFISVMLGQQSLSVAMHKAQTTANKEIQLSE